MIDTLIERFARRHVTLNTLWAYWFGLLFADAAIFRDPQAFRIDTKIGFFLLIFEVTALFCRMGEP